MDFIRAAFPDFTNQIQDIVSEGDRAFARLLLFSFAQQKIREVWVLGDIHGLLRQLDG